MTNTHVTTRQRVAGFSEIRISFSENAREGIF